MHLRHAILALASLPATLAAQAVPAVQPARLNGFDFTIQNIMRGPEVYGRQPANVQWTADGRWIHFLWNPPGTRSISVTTTFRAPASATPPPRRPRPGCGGARSRGWRRCLGRAFRVRPLLALLPGRSARLLPLVLYLFGGCLVDPRRYCCRPLFDLTGVASDALYRVASHFSRVRCCLAVTRPLCYRKRMRGSIHP